MGASSPKGSYEPLVAHATGVSQADQLKGCYPRWSGLPMDREDSGRTGPSGGAMQLPAVSKDRGSPDVFSGFHGAHFLRQIALLDGFRALRYGETYVTL